MFDRDFDKSGVLLGAVKGLVTSPLFEPFVRALEIKLEGYRQSLEKAPASEVPSLQGRIACMRDILSLIKTTRNTGNNGTRANGSPD